MSQKSFFQSRRWTIVLIALVTVLAIHVIAQNGENARVDMTADELYSLSDGTREILDRMHQEGVQPIDLKLFFSAEAGKTLPRFIKDFITYEKYLEALLREYEVASNGKVKVDFIDPVPDSDDSQDALDYGLDGRPINQHGDLFFFGLVAETQTGSREVIEFLWPNQQESIEYEITKLLANLAWPQKQRIGVLSSLEVVSEADNPYMRQILAAQGKNPGESWIAVQLLEEQYEVSRIDTDTDRISSDDYDLVIVVHPKSLGERALWALDEWIVRGGNTMIFLDAYSINDQPEVNPQQPWAQFQYDPSSNLASLMEGWGVVRAEGKVAADFNLAVSRPVTRRGPAERVIVDLQIDEETRSETLDLSHPILQGLSDLRFFIPGALEETTGGEGLTKQALITTTREGNTVTMEAGFPDPSNPQLVFADLNDPGKVMDAFTPGTAPVALAYLIQGSFPSHYPDGADLPGETPPPPPGLPPGIQLPPPPAGETVHVDPVPAEEHGEATVLVFADVDLIADPVAFQQTPFGALAANDNHKVFLNAVDYLFGSQSLMKVRSKAPIERPFTLFDEIEQQAASDMLEREKDLRAEIALVEEQLQEKQRGMAGQNAALFEKQLQDEIDSLNGRIREAESELRDIRQARRAALEGEEAKVRFATLGITPALVLMLGLVLFFRRRQMDQRARRT